MNWTIRSLVFSLFLVAKFHCDAQILFPDSPKEWLNHVDYIDSITTDRINRHAFYDSSGFGNRAFRWVDPEVRVLYNAKSPFSINDGAAWRGRGLTTELLAGFQVKKKYLQVSLAPIIFFSQNSTFQNSRIISQTKSKWNYQFNAIGDIDYVTRYGNRPFLGYDWGQSELALNYRKVGISLSSQNLQFGPAREAPLLLSQQGSGVKHLNLGMTDYQSMQLKNIQLGSIRANLIYGLLNESDYFDEITANDQRYFNAFSLSYILPYIQTIKIGVNRVFYSNLEYFETKDLTRTFAYFADPDKVVNNNGDTINDYFDQLGSFYIEWSLKESGFRWYLEFAKNDFFQNFRDLLVDPEHSRGYNIGFEKKYELSRERKFILAYETANLSRASSFAYRPSPSYYTHYDAVQGYTNDGQMLGAWIGPGSSIHSLTLSYLKQNDFIKLDLQRVQINDDYFIETFGSNLPQNLLQRNQELRYSNVNVLLSVYKNTDRFGYYFRLGGNLHLNKNYQLRNDEFNLVSNFTVVYKINRK